MQDLYAQRLQKLAFDAELKLLNRMIDRIEQNENFSYKKKYCGILFGDVPSFRERYYGKDNANNLELIGQRLLTLDGFGMVMLNNGFKDCSVYADKYKTDKKTQTIIVRLYNAGILDKLQPFPHKDSIVVFEDIIVFVASKGILYEIREMVKGNVKD